MVSPVLFLDAFTEMALERSNDTTEVDIAIEVGPHAALSGPIGDILTMPAFQGKNISYASCLVRNVDAVETMQSLVCQLLSRGVQINMDAVNFPLGRYGAAVLHHLPSYPWNHQVRHWSEPRMNKCHRDKQFPYHDLLGSMVTGVNPNIPTWRHVLRTSNLPWMSEHTVQSNVVYPGAGYISMAIEAITQYSFTVQDSIVGYRLRDVDIKGALIIPSEPQEIEVQITLTPVSDTSIGVKGWKEFQIWSVGIDNKWTEHCTGLISIETQGTTQGRIQSPAPKPLRGHIKHVDPSDIYAQLRLADIYHGPIFQNLDKIQVSDGRSASELSVPDIASIMPSQYQTEHVIHPTTLDTVFVSAYSAILSDDSQQGDAKVPKSIKNLWIAKGINAEAGHKFVSYVDVVHSDSRVFKSDISVTNASNSGSDIPVLSLEGFTCQSLGASLPREPDEYKQDICSTVSWEADISFMDHDRLYKETSFPVDKEEEKTILNLRRACFHYIRDAMSTVTALDVHELEWHHKKFYVWMTLQMALASRGELGPESSQWVNDTSEEKTALFASVASSSVNGEVVCRLGPQLNAILRKTVTPLELLMEDKLLYKYYQQALKFDRATIQISKIVKHLSNKNPRLRILEIGAGTGGTTRGVLQMIGSGKASGFGPLAAEYHFTDVSSGFFGHAQAQFEDWNSLMTYRKLDIENDPAKQGFELGSYDLIIAGQVLHATKSMKTTMTHVRSLLKSGGKLIMMESTKSQMDMQFTFGPLPGWWLSK